MEFARFRAVRCISDCREEKKSYQTELYIFRTLLHQVVLFLVTEDSPAGVCNNNILDYYRRSKTVSSNAQPQYICNDLYTTRLPLISVMNASELRE